MTGICYKQRSCIQTNTDCILEDLQNVTSPEQARHQRQVLWQLVRRARLEPAPVLLVTQTNEPEPGELRGRRALLVHLLLGCILLATSSRGLGALAAGLGDAGLGDATAGSGAERLQLNEDPVLLARVRPQGRGPRLRRSPIVSGRDGGGGLGVCVCVGCGG